MINKAGRTKHRHRTHSSITEAYIKQKFRFTGNSDNTINRRIFDYEFLVESWGIFKELRQMPLIQRTINYSATELACNLRRFIAIFGIAFLIAKNSSISFSALSIDLTKFNSLLTKMRECRPVKIINSRAEAIRRTTGAPELRDCLY